MSYREIQAQVSTAMAAVLELRDLENTPVKRVDGRGKSRDPNGVEADRRAHEKKVREKTDEAVSRVLEIGIGVLEDLNRITVAVEAIALNTMPRTEGRER